MTARRSPNVFGHGQLRLYLLQLVAEQPVTGYDIIRLMENRFLGLYTPSTGTVYPRLHRLESDGLITRSKVGSRSIYSISPTGQQELTRRREDLDLLTHKIDGRQQELADEVRAQVYDRAEETRSQLDTAAAELRRSQRHGLGEEVLGALGDARENLRHIARRRWFPRSAGGEEPVEHSELDRRLLEFGETTLRAARSGTATAEQLEEVAAVLAEASARVREILEPE
jgi:DNA-binding PadR family transcriptional regulator